jgi:hypothetical protein
VAQLFYSGLVVLGMQSRCSCMIGRHSPVDPYLQVQLF